MLTKQACWLVATLSALGAALGCSAGAANLLHHDVNEQTPPLCRGGLANAVGAGERQVKILKWEGDEAEVLNACGWRMKCNKNMPGSIYTWQCVKVD